jgi:hypothetical protein
MSINTPSSAPAENTSTLPPSPEAKLNTLERQVALASPNKPKVPPEDKPEVPFASETSVVWQKSETSEMITPKNTEEAKKTLWDRVKNMSSQFGTKITEAYENSKDAIQGGLKTIGGFIGMDKLKWWWEKMIAKLQWDGFFAKLFGGKWGWAEKLLSKIFGIGDVKAGELPNIAKIEGKYATTYGVVAELLQHGEKKELPLANPLTHPDFQKTPIADFKKMQQTGNYTKLYQTLPDQWFDEKKKKETLETLIDRLFNSVHLTARVLEQSYKSGTKNQTLEEGITLESYFQGASRVIRKFKWLPWMVKSGISGKDAVILKLSEKWDDIDGLTTDDEQAFSFSTPELRKKYLLEILSNGTQRYAIGQKEVTIQKILNTGVDSRFKWLSEVDQKEVQTELAKLFDFADGFAWQIRSNSQVNLGIDTGDVLKKGLSYRWLISMYHIMDGRYEYKDMSILEKAQFHSLVTGILWFGSDSGTSGKLAGAYVEALNKSEAHREVRVFLEEVATFAGKTAAKGLWESIKWSAWFIQSSPGIGSAIIALNLPLFSNPESALDKVWL